MDKLNDINEIFNTLLNRKVVLNEMTTPQDIEGWDSLFQANLIETVEKKYGIKFKLREILAWDSVGNIINCINKHLG